MLESKIFNWTLLTLHLLCYLLVFFIGLYCSKLDWLIWVSFTWAILLIFAQYFSITIKLFLLLTIYKVKSGNWVINSTFIKYQDISNQDIITKEEKITKLAQVKIRVAYNKIFFNVTTDETTSINKSSSISNVLLLSGKIIFLYNNTSNVDEKDSHEGVAILDCKNRRMEYFNKYPRLSKGTYTFGK